ncbi:hypothetical protein Taro_037968 [Colocasia esculenta]|uniref:Uncharacterized protein n=1 Tax=Colocasia esculenta TaxID=4460 RepID=A0A843W5G6_COLES|nr:hypothetical protein [Colocasia esculenta]
MGQKNGPNSTPPTFSSREPWRGPLLHPATHSFFTGRGPAGAETGEELKDSKSSPLGLPLPFYRPGGEGNRSTPPPLRLEGWGATGGTPPSG